MASPQPHRSRPSSGLYAYREKIEREELHLIARPGGGASGASATYTGTGTTAWAGGRSGPDYAVQGNILAGEKVVAALERAFRATKGRADELCVERGWTAFMERRFPAALAAQERAATLAPHNGEVLYDLAVIRLANGKREDALAALRKALAANPKLVAQAALRRQSREPAIA